MSPTPAQGCNIPRDASEKRVRTAVVVAKGLGAHQRDGCCWTRPVGSCTRCQRRRANRKMQIVRRREVQGSKCAAIRDRRIGRIDRGRRKEQAVIDTAAGRVEQIEFAREIDAGTEIQRHAIHELQRAGCVIGTDLCGLRWPIGKPRQRDRQLQVELPGQARARRGTIVDDRRVGCEIEGVGRSCARGGRACRIDKHARNAKRADRRSRHGPSGALFHPRVPVAYQSEKPHFKEIMLPPQWFGYFKSVTKLAKGRRF